MHNKKRRYFDEENYSNFIKNKHNSLVLCNDFTHDQVDNSSALLIENRTQMRYTSCTFDDITSKVHNAENLSLEITSNASKNQDNNVQANFSEKQQEFLLALSKYFNNFVDICEVYATECNFKGRFYRGKASLKYLTDETITCLFDPVHEGHGIEYEQLKLTLLEICEFLNTHKYSTMISNQGVENQRKFVLLMSVIENSTVQNLLKCEHV
jgi:hypothetical protein